MKCKGIIYVMETFFLINCQIIKSARPVWIFLRLCSLLLSNLFMIYEGRRIRLKNDKENVTCLKSASGDNLESLKYTESEYRTSLE